VVASKLSNAFQAASWPGRLFAGAGLRLARVFRLLLALGLHHSSKEEASKEEMAVSGRGWANLQ